MHGFVKRIWGQGYYKRKKLRQKLKAKLSEIKHECAKHPKCNRLMKTHHRVVMKIYTT